MKVILIIILTLFALWIIYENLYYKSKKFKEMKNKIYVHINNCNELNHHIEELKTSSIITNQRDYGRAYYYDTSKWNYKRWELKKIRNSPYIYNCSRTVCDNARRQPFKYICKYFNIKATEESLEKVEKMLNDFEAVEQGKIVLKQEKEDILSSIKNEIPFFIKKFSKKRLQKELGFEEIDFSTLYFPKYEFKYVSSGGYASTSCDIEMNLDNLNRFIKYLSETIKFKKSIAGQRALMTSALRNKIIKRDNYTCRYCGASIYNEKHLLLEVDHIIPLSKGGVTTESNLQTLCWRCNRSKGSKMY